MTTETSTAVDRNASNNSVAAIPFWDACLFWLKLGFISFGGPAGQISIMHQELVEQRRWISERRFLHALNFCMLLPGPEAQQLATYLGWLMHKTWGGIVAGVLFVLPSLFILIGLSWIYITYGESTLIAGLFYGIKPAVTAIVLQAAHRIGSKTLKNRYLWAIGILSFTGLAAFDLPFPLIVASAGIIGIVGGKFAPTSFQSAPHKTTLNASKAPAIIDDHSPTPQHALFRWTKLIKVVAACAVLWILPMALLTYSQGWNSPLTQMGWFFTKAAFLTFGGAYAVLPYVVQGAVGHYGWLSTPQMMDGLALGETTPGPLIMVVAFVGFVGGYTKAVCGPELLFVGGALAACLVTWFTFLPSFLFIFAAGPLIESTHNEISFTAPLTAITAAIVGVILNLTLFFAYHVLYPHGLAEHVDWAACSVAFIAFLALFFFKQKVTTVIVECAILGLVYSQFMHYFH